jgi:hypothetical protein
MGEGRYLVQFVVPSQFGGLIKVRGLRCPDHVLLPAYTKEKAYV